MVIDPNPYAALELMPGSSSVEIKRRYRQLAKQYHPDRNGHAAGYEEKLRDLNAAYAFLSDAARKGAYDAQFAPVFQPAYLRRPVSYAASRRNWSLPVLAGLILLLLISTGIGILYTDGVFPPTFAGLVPQASGTVNTEAPAPVYDFVPSRSTFDDQSSFSSQTHVPSI